MVQSQSRVCEPSNRHARRIIRALAVASVVLLTSEAWPQEQIKATPITVGSRVRLRTATAVPGRIVGTVMEMDERSLLLSTDDHVPFRVARQDVTTVAISGGRRSRGQGAFVGTAIGAGTGALIGIVGGVTQNTGADQQALGATVGGGILALLGGCMGAAIGLAVPPAERWIEVPLDRVRVSLAPVHGGGMGLLVSVGF